MPTKAPSKKAPSKKAPAKKAAAKSTAKSSTKAKAKAAVSTPKKAPAKAKTKAAKAKAPAKTRAQSAGRGGKGGTAQAPRAAAGTEFRNFEPYTPKRGEEYMSDAQMDHFKDILRNWKAQLMEEVDRTVTHMKDEAANFPDPADRATQEEEFSLELRTRDRERKLIKKIDSTIEKINQDDYGFCDACGVEIGIKRLEARPTATLCIDCKTLDEIKERQELG